MFKAAAALQSALAHPVTSRSASCSAHLHSFVLLSPHVTSCQLQSLRKQGCAFHARQLRLGLLQVLSKKEIEWVNSYHKEVWEKAFPFMQHDKDLLAWVKKNTQPL